MICKKIISLLIALVSLVFSEVPVFEPMDNIDVAPMNITIYQSMNITVYSMYGDYDGDGLSNTDEKRIGSNPANYDTDGDGIWDGRDAFPLDANESVDTDGDGVGNNADTDDDNDGVLDAADAFPLDANESVDTDGDGVGNNADTDDDGDGVLDSDDAFPLDSSEWLDTDGDGIGNNADTDDDGDGVLDSDDFYPLDASKSQCPTINIGEDKHGKVLLGKYDYYKLHISAGQKVKITLSSLNDDADMYVGYGMVPTKDDNNCSSTNVDTDNEVCKVEAAADMDLYIGVYGYKESNYLLNIAFDTDENSGGGSNSGGSNNGGSNGGSGGSSSGGSSGGSSSGGSSGGSHSSGAGLGALGFLMPLLTLLVVWFRREEE